MKTQNLPYFTLNIGKTEDKKTVDIAIRLGVVLIILLKKATGNRHKAREMVSSMFVFFS